MKIARCLIAFSVSASLPFALPIQAAVQTQAPVELKYEFSSGADKPGFTRVAPTAAYSDATGYGYEPGAQVSAGDGGNTTTSDHPFLFSAKVPEGNYNVTVTLGDSITATTTTLKAESGRLMVERLPAPAGQVITRTFTTNVRTPHLPKLPLNATGREEVSLDQFDSGNSRDWDDKLTIEINSSHAALRSIEITSAPSVPTVFIAGDSTVTDRDGSGDISWGQVLPRFFKNGVAVSNQAQSGETLKSFANALRLDKILSQMKKGDYLFIQFTHNDEKSSWPQTYAAADTTFKLYLKVYIGEARLRGAIPVLVTAMDRGRNGAPAHAHGGYPEAMREVAKEENVPLIDLYTMSISLFESAGADATAILADGTTHSSAYGGYEFAKCIVMGIKQNKLDLVNYIADDFKDFDPAHPDAMAALDLGGIFGNAGSRGGNAGNAGTGGGARGGRRGGAAPAASPTPAYPPAGDPGPGPL